MANPEQEAQAQALVENSLAALAEAAPDIIKGLHRLFNGKGIDIVVTGLNGYAMPTNLTQAVSLGIQITIDKGEFDDEPESEPGSED